MLQILGEKLTESEIKFPLTLWGIFLNSIQSYKSHSEIFVLLWENKASYFAINLSMKYQGSHKAHREAGYSLSVFH